MTLKLSMDLADAILAGRVPDAKEYRVLLTVADEDILSLIAGADRLRRARFANQVHLCTICNGKSGRCSEDCSFCAQSAFARTDAPVYGIMPEEQMTEAGRRAEKGPVNRFSIVTSGKRLPRREVEIVARALSGLDRSRIATCASLGCLEREDMEILKLAGVTRYHHNLETAESFFEKICTTHTYAERIRTIEHARSAGLSICSGGIFGLGETDEQVLELALTVKSLGVDAVPLNFLAPIPGTPMAESRFLTPLRCLKIVAIFRYVLPDKDILICGGRELNLGQLHPLVFAFGASGIMTSDYLTTKGRSLEEDLAMLSQLGLCARPKA
ncbi:MAG: biotin synthase BioB [Desulfobacteraceae bacterium]|nr:MAG: biotin synthase BioB [Desulfobacteraceae bacterium]